MRPNSPPVAIVSASLARELYGNEGAIGRTLIYLQPFEIVGVVSDVRWRRPDEPPIPTLYRAGSSVGTFIVSTREDPRSFSIAVRRLLRSIDQNQAVDFVVTLEGRVNEALSEHRFFAFAATSFGVVSLLLSTIGIFAVVSASVSERVKEIGIRAALGATQPALLRLAMRHGVVPVGVGLIVGIMCAFGSVGLVRSLLFEVSPADPIAFLVSPVLVLMVAVIAAWLPGRRATRINPAEALRCD